ncbi:MAG: response regulator [Synergistaceae bacterium]|nr:response regulator [Synergistaceae bacterium]
MGWMNRQHTNGMGLVSKSREQTPPTLAVSYASNMPYAEGAMKLRFILFFILFIFALFSVVGIFSVQQYKDAAANIARRLGEPILKRAVAMIDGDKFERLCKTLDPSDPFYDETRKKLLALKEETQCLYIYTMAPFRRNIHRFIIDGGNPGEEGFSALGDEEDVGAYTGPYLKTYETQSMQFGNIEFQENWGWLIPAYSPLFNSSGVMVGIVACDFAAESAFRAVRTRIFQQLAIAAVFILVGCVLYFSMLRAIIRQNKEFFEMKLKAEAASRSKSAFLARMSHDIRTPMNAIIGMSELAQRERDAQTMAEYIVDIKRSGIHLLSIINDILDFSKIESNQVELVNERYCTASMLNDVLTIVSTQINDKFLGFSYDVDTSIPAFLVGDVVRVRQILLNLLSNAVKYTEKGYVKLTVMYTHEMGDTILLMFVVEDSGIGIKPNDMGRIFDEFSRADIQRNVNIEGTGLGLPIARKLCRVMGGDVTASSEYGKGSTFAATISQTVASAEPMGNFWDRENEPSDKGNRANFAAPGFHVLVVDDVKTNLKVAEGLLARYEVDVDTCESGEASIAHVQNIDYDLVLMDHMMPGMDGIEATAAIRALGGRFEALPIVALTANAVSGMREIFLANKFNDFLSKPIELKKLDELMHKWIPAAKRIEKRAKRRSDAKAQEPARPDGAEGLGADVGLAPAGGMDGAAPDVLRADETEFTEMDANGRSGLFDGLSVDGLDIERGIARFGNEESYLAVLRSYEVNTPDLLDRLNSSLEGALSDYAVNVHGIKGSSYGICADTVGKLAEEQERAARAEEAESVRTNHGKLIAAAHTFLGEAAEMLKVIERRMSELNAPKERIPAPDSKLIQQMLSGAILMDTYMMEETMLLLERYDYDYGGDLIQWLRAQLDVLDYSAIKERLEKGQF